MEYGIWELRKSREGVASGEIEGKTAGGEMDEALGEPVWTEKSSLTGLSTVAADNNCASASIENDHPKAEVKKLDTSASSDAVCDMEANLDLSLGDELDNIHVENAGDHNLTFDENIDQPKYSPKLSIEDHLDRITVPVQSKRTSIISQRSAISANLTNFNNANTGIIPANLSADSQKKPASVQESHSSLTLDQNGTVISCHNVSYQVKVPGSKRCRCGGLKEHKFILKDVSGLFRPGLNAILGPTGSGKSSLLDMVAGRKDPRGQSGQVLINGSQRPHNFKCMSGYVIQDDTVMGMLTVRENIQFSAALRLPTSVSQEKRNQRVDEVLAELGLTKCANTRVGTELRRGVSGGERKRTTIGMELITSPSVLFLDEPTTGLDANTAYSVVHLLKKLAQRGKTVLFSIHQPRYSIFKLFDNLMLLSHGENVYCGPPADSLKYFNGIGYFCEEHNNPSDFFLDVINGGIQPYQLPVTNDSSNASPKPNGIAAETEVLIDSDEDGPDEDTCLARQRLLVQQFRKSPISNKLIEDLRPIYLDYEKSELNDTLVRLKVQYPTHWINQIKVVSGRTFRNMYRNPHTLSTQVCFAIIVGLIVGTIYYQVDNSFKSGIQNRVGAFFFIVMNHVFGNMASVDMFIKERALFIHENVSGFYRISAYFLAKLFCDVLPMKIMPIMVFSTVTYWMIGLYPAFTKFMFFILNTVLTSLSGTSVALLFSATVTNHTIGTLLTAMVWVFMMVFSGLLVNVDTIPGWLQWMKYLSIFRYSMNGYTVNELKDTSFCDVESSVNVTMAEQKCDYGNQYMLRQGIPYSTYWDLWQNELALLLISLVFLILTYIQLRNIQKHR